MNLSELLFGRNYENLVEARITRFRKNNPKFSRSSSITMSLEKYERDVCTDAVNVAEALKTVDKINTFSKASSKEQYKMVPRISKGHSGNSFGQVCTLAATLIERPELFEYAHGALCAFIGCKDYGCYAAYPDGTIPKDNKKNEGKNIK